METILNLHREIRSESSIHSGTRPIKMIGYTGSIRSRARSLGVTGFPTNPVRFLTKTFMNRSIELITLAERKCINYVL